MNALGLTICLALFTLGNADPFNGTKTLEKLLEGYDKRFRPNWGGPPVEVGITMYFIRFFDINTKDMSVKSDYYFRHTWQDPRLAFDAPASVQSLVLGKEAASMFWMPDTFSADGTASNHANEDNNMFFTRLERDGTILSSVRVFEESSLPMDLKYFPMDEQTYTLNLESYGYSAKDISYKWQKGSGSVGMSEECGTVEFEVVGRQLRTDSIRLSTGNYSRLAVDVRIVRNSNYYMRHFYFPAIVAFLLAWASFWFHANYSTVRALLILTSFLTGNYLLVGVQEFLPPVNYPTMLEKFITFQMVMAALAVAECIIVVYLYRRSSKSTSNHGSDLETSLLDGDSKPGDKDKGEEKKSLNSYFSRSAQYVINFRQHRRTYQKVDLVFRALYPIIFIIYNIWYWMAFPAVGQKI